ncbi:hypothetical protein C8R43DRAFT_1065279 [Mycena crocata]|nr:hypothetical protein C8R43DRAFT_1065279 [Mycena crocata]
MRASISILATLLMAVAQISANPVPSAADAASAERVSCPKASGASAFYRMYNRKTGDHFYTASSSEKKSFGKKGYKLQEVSGLVFKSQQKNTVPFYRLVGGSDHFYTMSKSERHSAVAGGFKKDGTAGYIFATQICGSTPLYRYYNGSDHFYTTSQTEGENAVTNSGYMPENVAGFILPA